MAPPFTKSETNEELKMKIKFLRDCGLGKKGNGKEGKTMDVEDAMGVELIQCSAAVEVKEKEKKEK